MILLKLLKSLKQLLKMEQSQPGLSEHRALGLFTALIYIYELIIKKKQFSFACLIIAVIISSTLEVLTLSSLIPIISTFGADEIVVPSVVQDLMSFFGIELNFQLAFLDFIFLFCVLMIANAVFRITLSWLMARFLMTAKYDLSQNLFECFLKLDLRNFLTFQTSDITNQVIREVEYFLNYATAPIVNFARDGILTIFLLGFLFWVSPKEAAILLIVLAPFAVFINFLSVLRVKYWAEPRVVLEERRMRIVHEALSLFKELKVFQKEAFFSNLFKENGLKIGRIEVFQSVFRSITRPAIEVYIGFILLLLIFGANFTKENFIFDERLIIIGAVLIRVIPLYGSLAQSIHSIRFVGPITLSFHNRLINLNLKVPNEIGNSIGYFNKHIEYKNVLFKHIEDVGEILDGANFTIKKGEVVALIGDTGSGKSTVADLLMGLMKPSKGSIKIDGKILLQDDALWWSKIGFVSQSTVLIADTVKNNIALGVPEAQQNQSRLNEVVEVAQLANGPCSVDEMLSKYVGDKGCYLSGGERQRVCLARALYLEPELLILDEPTSALDKSTELRLLKELIMNKGSLTILMITHSQRVIEFADSVLSLKNGKIIKIR